MICLNLFYTFKVKESAVELAKAMENEDGVEGAVQAFHKHFPQKKIDSEPEEKRQFYCSLRHCFGHS